MMKEFHVSDYRKDGRSDSQAIRACLTAAAEAENRVIVFDGPDYLIEEAILLSDHTTVIVKDCTIRQKDLVFDNIFRGNNLVLDPENPCGYALEVRPLTDIRILGLGQAVLSGCLHNAEKYHPFFQETQTAVGDFWGWRTHLINFSCCTQFEISSLKIVHTRGWAMSFDMSSQGWIHDIDFDTHVKNGDGIDFRMGCSRMLVENIGGYTSDDTVACTAIRGKETETPSKYLYPAEPVRRIFYHDDIRTKDIHDITIRNIHAGGYFHSVICLAAGGLRVHHVNISDIREGGRLSERASALVSAYTAYQQDYAPGDLHHLNLSDVTANHNQQGALESNAEVAECTFRHLENLGGGPKTVLQHPEGWTRLS